MQGEIDGLGVHFTWGGTNGGSSRGAMTLLQDIRECKLCAARFAQTATAHAPRPVATQNWRDHAPSVFPLPHPSWRNTAWLKQNPWFEADVLPRLRSAVKEALE